ncbi:NADH(P)-binding-domain-containing protein [Cladochytrium replicatum]|nr:NADH(P)-binding-domain-containing protein [Cladochytrium replicatum]
MKIAIIGSTGKTGINLVPECLKRNHSVYALVRTSSKVPEQIRDNPLYHMFQGDVKNDSAVLATIENADVVISAVGPPDNAPTTVVQDTTIAVLKALKSLKMKPDLRRPRFILLTSGGCNDEIVKEASWGYQNIVKPHILDNVYDDLIKAEKILLDAGAEDPTLDYVILEPPQLVPVPPTGTYMMMENKCENVGKDWPVPFADVSLGLLDLAEGKYPEFNRKRIGIGSTTLVDSPFFTEQVRSMIWFNLTYKCTIL